MNRISNKVFLGLFQADLVIFISKYDSMKTGIFSRGTRFAALIIMILPIVGTLKGLSQNIAPITRMGAVSVLPFDEGWRFSRFGLQADGTSVTEPAGLENPDLVDTDWRKLDLPHDWAVEGPFRIELEGETGKLPYQGIGWYRKHFSVSTADAGRQVFVDFDGAMAYAKVWLNGHYIGTWPYGYTSFRMDLTPYLKFGQANVLAVRLDTEKWESRWYPGAGIYRHVWLVKTNPVHVKKWGAFARAEVRPGEATVRIRTEVENHGKGVQNMEMEGIAVNGDIASTTSGASGALAPGTMIDSPP